MSKEEPEVIPEFTSLDPVEYFAHCDAETGDVITCYATDIHTPDTIPADAIQMTDDQFWDHVHGDVILMADMDQKPPVFVAKPEVAPSLDQVKAIAKEAVVRWINTLTAQMRAGYPKDEVATWPLKGPQAREVLAGGEVGKLIAGEVSTSGKTAEEVAASVVARADAYEEIMGKVSGLRQSVQAAIDAATDAPGVQAAVDAGLAAGTAEAASYGLSVEAG